MGEVLWRPTGERTRLDEFADAVVADGGPAFDSYEELWRWSTTDLEAFWSAVWRHFDLPADGDATVAVADDSMPGAVWFPDVRLNYAEAMLQMPGRADDDVVVIARSQSRDEIRITAAELRDQVARARAGLVRFGVGPGDRVAAYAPNIPETLVLMLAAASLGAVFSSCAPEFGVQSVIDRWQQIEPKLLLAVDGYTYGTKAVDRRGEVEAIRARLPSVHTVVWLPYLDDHAPDPASTVVDGAKTWADLVAVHDSGPAPLEFERLPFATPLYVLFSSGTTGLPKPIMHGHGGITIEHLKVLALQSDLGPTDRFFWFSTTGWMMWNYLASGIGVGATIALFDGNPAHPDLSMLWHLADELELTYFGTSAPFLLQCRKEELVPRDLADLSYLRALGSTGAPLPAEGFRWVYEAVSDTLQLASVSGGTDVCSAFVGAAPTVPVYAGEISCRSLGCAVDAFDETGRPVVDELGELVITQPMPSMPVGFWGDDDGSRYREAYFEDFPGVWRHGDWITITERGTCVVTGRSDATLNRGGVRLGTSEFYSVVESLPGVADSLVVHLEDDEGGAGTLILFVVLAEGQELDDDLRASIARELRTRLSPRHIPDEVHAVPALPRTLSGKKLEVPVKKILRGAAVDDVAAKGALTDPDSLDVFVGLRS
ncbi:acetoacetate--CoA ligase [Aeromicrobium sp.]|uniref:acetoacetate--CoA ligase n=1 Tax=Aeromicrobium sp. TaxID=1871063 RepID=UPI003D6AF576